MEKTKKNTTQPKQPAAAVRTSSTPSAKRTPTAVTSRSTSTTNTLPTTTTTTPTSRVCATCGQGTGQLSTLTPGVHVHPTASCLVCWSCQCPLQSTALVRTEILVVDGGRLVCRACHDTGHAPVCAGCSGRVTGPVLVAAGKRFHSGPDWECFRCDKCGAGVEGKTWYPHEGGTVCARCVVEVTDLAPRCEECGKGMMTWVETGPKPIRTCPGGAHPHLVPCFSCGSLTNTAEPTSQLRGLRLEEDSRAVCMACHASAVVDEQRASALLPVVISTFLAEAAIPAATAETLKRVKVRLTSKTELLSLARSSVHSQATLFGITRMEKRSEVMVSSTSGLRRTLSETRGVPEIVILSGLPVTTFLSTLSHELAHALMFIDSFPSLSPADEEGVCELFAAKALAHIQQSGTQLAQVEGVRSDLAQWTAAAMKKRTDRVYGAGFAKASALQRSLGGSLGKVLQRVKADRAIKA
jgi:hypothetical protein